MRKGVVTIVLPIYNVERYLERCLNSILNQTYRNLEIILVDDGSPDRCPEICDEWAKRDNRIKVIHKENAGLGYARNTGIENATGEYICFFDSDDYVSLDAIEKAYGLASKERAEIVTFGFCTVKTDGTIESTIIPCTDKTLYVGEEVQNTFLPDLIGFDTSTGKAANLHMSAWASLYSLQLIRKAKWEFASEREIISEDVYSLLWLYKWVDRVAVLSEALYFYCENAGSLTHTYRSNRYKQICHFYNECQVACDKIGYGEEVKRRLSYPYLSNTIAALKMITLSDLEKYDKKSLLKEIMSDKTLNEVLNKIDLSKEKKKRKILLYLIKQKKYVLCELLLMVKLK